MALYCRWCIRGCDDGNIWPCACEALGMPRLPVVVTVADAPLTPHEVVIANSTGGSCGWDFARLHGSVGAGW